MTANWYSRSLQKGILKTHGTERIRFSPRRSGPHRPTMPAITSLMLANHVTKEDVIRNSVQTEKQRLVALAVLLIDM